MEVVFIVVVVNGIIYSLSNIQYVLPISKDVLQETKVVVCSLIGGLKNSQDVVVNIVIQDVIE